MKKRYGRRTRPDGRSEGSAQHVRLYRWMMQTQAWQRLPGLARALLVELLALHNGHNNGELFLSVREAAQRLNCDKNAAHAAFGILEEHGFIRPHVKGAFTRKTRHATSWVLTEFEHGGQPPTKDFTRWQLPPEIQNAVLPGRRSVRPRGQTPRAAQRNFTNCPPHGTDSASPQGATVPMDGHS